MDTNLVPNRWALLIGINFYPKKPLHGCVRDVHMINDYFQGASVLVNIATLTASVPLDPNLRVPPEEPESWPTYANITSQLHHITAQAEAGDLVYLHFSGHGTRHDKTGDFGLVLFHEIKGVHYMWGERLASEIDKMVKKGLHVIVILDCCFSGGILRHDDLEDAAIRTIAYDSAVDATYPNFPNGSRSGRVGSPVRDASVVPKWLMEPNGYTILTACGPHEEAEELTLRSEEKNGALSYFLVDALIALRKRPVQITHESLYRYLCIQFHAYWPKQYPMCYGNLNLDFFGKFSRKLDTKYIQVFKPDNQPLQLWAGYVHGVCEGDEYALCALNSPENVALDSINAQLRVKIDKLHDFTSDLVAVEPNVALTKVKTGWKALPLTSLSSRKVLVRLMPAVGNRAQWTAAANKKGCLYLSVDGVEGQPCLFNVTRNIHDEYEILDESHRSIFSLPKIPCGRKESLHSIVDILAHLSSFKYFERIENRIQSDAFKTQFRLQIRDGAGRDLSQAAIARVQDGDLLKLTLENLSSNPLYLAIFDLGPLWQIDSLLSQNGGSGFQVVEPKNKWCEGISEIQWHMSVPKEFTNEGRYQCDDILKVFVTSKPSEFAPLLLPKVAGSVDGLDQPVRGDFDHLSRFLSYLVAPFRGSEHEFVDEWWSTEKFHIRTTKENKS